MTNEIQKPTKLIGLGKKMQNLGKNSLNFFPINLKQFSEQPQIQHTLEVSRSSHLLQAYSGKTTFHIKN